jgi:predicted ATPase
MIYLNTFKLSEKTVTNPNLYPYNLFKHKSNLYFIFDKITVFYGDNACGKSTLLNIIANKLNISGKEKASGNIRNPYFRYFLSECTYDLGDDENGIPFRIPDSSRYIKSEDIMYEIKKIQQEAILQEGYLYEHAKKGYSKEQLNQLKNSKEMYHQIEIMKFAQEKYSNGETSLQIFDDYLQPDALFLLDEPEVSLSPQNQVHLAEKINQAARLFDNQFIISTHSPFMLGTLSAKIYDIGSEDFDVCHWSQLKNVKFYYDFFQKRKDQFE